MKFNQGLIGVSMIFAMSAGALAQADTTLWQCTGDNVEGIAVSAEQNGKFPAGVSWDCWGGGGICERNVKATMERKDGKTIFNDPNFTLEIDNTPGRDGSYSGHISASGEGPSDMGGGLDIDESVNCTRGDSN
jgi:hypothetical protein